MREVWKVVPGFNSHYQVSSTGNIRTVPRKVPTIHGPKFCIGIPISQRLANGIPMVKLNGNYYRVCDIVASAFLPKPGDHYVLLHKNNNPLNNNVSNLIWASTCTAIVPQDLYIAIWNAAGCTKTIQDISRKYLKKKKLSKTKKAVYCVTTNTHYDSMTAAAKAMGDSWIVADISRSVLLGKPVKGYLFKEDLKDSDRSEE